MRSLQFPHRRKLKAHKSCMFSTYHKVFAAKPVIICQDRQLVKIYTATADSCMCAGVLTKDCISSNYVATFNL